MDTETAELHHALRDMMEEPRNVVTVRFEHALMVMRKTPFAAGEDPVDHARWEVLEAVRRMVQEDVDAIHVITTRDPAYDATYSASSVANTCFRAGMIFTEVHYVDGVRGVVECIEELGATSHYEADLSVTAALGNTPVRVYLVRTPELDTPPIAENVSKKDDPSQADTQEVITPVAKHEHVVDEVTQFARSTGSAAENAAAHDEDEDTLVFQRTVGRMDLRTRRNLLSHTQKLGDDTPEMLVTRVLIEDSTELLTAFAATLEQCYVDGKCVKCGAAVDCADHETSCTVGALELLKGQYIR